MARIRSFKKIQADDATINKLQENVDEFLLPITNSAIIDGILLTGVVLTTGTTNQVEHKLQRPPLGWIIVRQRANASIWDSQDSNNLKGRLLFLECSANVTVDIWVF